MKSTVKKKKAAKPVKARTGDVGKEFIRTCREHLVGEYLPKFRTCLDELSEEDVWWRAHETDNSVGNLLLHLNGNMRQWIIAGIAGKEFVRNRDQEFAERRKIPKAELWKLFEETVMEVDRALGKFDVARLTEVRHFQKWDHTCLFAIAHVVEHVGQHMGQIIYLTKLKKGIDLKLVRL